MRLSWREYLPGFPAGSTPGAEVLVEVSAQTPAAHVVRGAKPIDTTPMGVTATVPNPFEAYRLE